MNAHPRHPGDHACDVTVEAEAFARRDPAEADALLSALTREAILGWSLEDATFWQRVRFRSRMMRATRSGATNSVPEGEPAC